MPGPASAITPHFPARRCHAYNAMYFISIEALPQSCSLPLHLRMPSLPMPRRFTSAARRALFNYIIAVLIFLLLFSPSAATAFFKTATTSHFGHIAIEEIHKSPHRHTTAFQDSFRATWLSCLGDSMHDWQAKLSFGSLFRLMLDDRWASATDSANGLTATSIAFRRRRASRIYIVNFARINISIILNTVNTYICKQFHSCSRRRAGA